MYYIHCLLIEIILYKYGQVKALAVGSVKSVKEASERWNISERWIQKLCEEGRIEGVQRFGRFWMIPKEAQKPADLRKNRKGRSDISHV